MFPCSWYRNQYNFLWKKVNTKSFIWCGNQDIANIFCIFPQNDSNSLWQWEETFHFHEHYKSSQLWLNYFTAALSISVDLLGVIGWVIRDEFVQWWLIDPQLCFTHRWSNGLFEIPLICCLCSPRLKRFAFMCCVSMFHSFRFSIVTTGTCHIMIWINTLQIQTHYSGYLDKSITGR